MPLVVVRSAPVLRDVRGIHRATRKMSRPGCSSTSSRCRRRGRLPHFTGRCMTREVKPVVLRAAGGRILIVVGVGRIRPAAVVVPGRGARRHVLIDLHDRCPRTQMLISHADDARGRDLLLDLDAAWFECAFCSCRPSWSSSRAWLSARWPAGCAGNTGAPACAGDRLTPVCRSWVRSVVLPAGQQRVGHRAQRHAIVEAPGAGTDQHPARFERRPGDARPRRHVVPDPSRSSPDTAGRSGARVDRHARARAPLVLHEQSRGWRWSGDRRVAERLGEAGCCCRRLPESSAAMKTRSCH